jgi:hydroxymethylpyrimidine pyrophosphatase-like HAD family hydrolase
LLGINDPSVQIPEEVKQSFLSVIREDSLKQREKKIKSFGKNSEFEAAIDYFDLINHGNAHSSKYEKKLKKAAEKHPEYAILQLRMAKLNLEHKENLESLPYYPFKMENFFKGREYIHSWEMFCYLDFYTHLVIAEQNFAKLDALKTVIRELDISKDEIAVFDSLITIMQTALVAQYFKDEKNPESN